jgi:hypothetical protein
MVFKVPSDRRLEQTNMKLSKITGTAALLFLAATLPAYAQKDEKENGKDQQPQHAQQAKPAQQPHPEQKAKQAPQLRPAQQAQQPRQQSPPKAQEHPQQAKAPEQQQSKPSPVRNSEQHAQPAVHQAARTPQAQHAVAAHAAQAPQVQRSASQAKSWQQQRGWVKQGGGWQPHTSFQQGRDQNWASDHRDWAQRGGYGGAYIPQASFGLYFGSAHYFHIGTVPVMYMGYPRFAYGGYSFMVLDPWPGSWQENWYASDDVYIDYSDGYYLHDRRYPGVSLAVSVVL